MQDVIEFSGNRYSSVRSAADTVGLSRDYVARLCRSSMVQAKRVGTAWYVDLHSLRALLRAQDYAREYRRTTLSRQRTEEYRAKQAPKVSAAAAPLESVKDRMQRAIDGSLAAGAKAVSDTSRAPGLMHAAASIPAQALVHVPVYALTPAVELAHRLVALVSAFVIVFGAYSLVDHTYAALAYDSTSSALTSVTNMSEEMASASAAEDTDVTAWLEAFAQDPSHYAAAVRVAGGERVSFVARSVDGAFALARSSLRPQAAPASSAAAVGLAVPNAAAPDATAVPSLGSPIAVAIPFTGDHVAYGDLVAFDAKSDVYSLTSGSNDPNAFGIVVQDPALLFRPQGTNSNISIIRSGSALLNVTLEGGEIAVGDPLTASSIPGKARKAQAGEHVIGTAGEAFSGAGGVALSMPDGSTVESGTISVNAGLGSDSSSASSGASCASASCKLVGALDPQIVRALIRYVLSGLIAAISLTFAFRSFMSDANYGVISIGRNPRAKSSIQSLVFFNAILALAIASAGLFAAIMVLFSG